MRLLVDTNVLLWALTDHPRLSRGARSAIGDRRNDILLSPVSLYELCFKAWLGKLPGFSDTAFESFVTGAGYEWLVLHPADMKVAATLDWAERDPWDRLIVAQAILNECVVVSADRSFRTAPVEILW